MTPIMPIAKLSLRKRTEIARNSWHNSMSKIEKPLRLRGALASKRPDSRHKYESFTWTYRKLKRMFIKRSKRV